MTVNADFVGRPFEVFAALGNAGLLLTADAEAICPRIFLAVRFWVPVEKIRQQLRGISTDQALGADAVLSLPAAIGRALPPPGRAGRRPVAPAARQPEEEAHPQGRKGGASTSVPRTQGRPMPAQLLSHPTLPPTDEDLFARWVEHRDEQAFRVIVERLQPQLHAFICKRVSSADRAADLCSETFLRMTHSADRYVSTASKLRTWAHVIANNLLKNEFRNARRAREVLFSEMEGPEGVSAPAFDTEGGDDPEANVYRTEVRAAIESAVRGLHEHQRVPFVLREFEDRTYEEIAEAVGTNVGTVKSRLNRARRNVRARLLAFQ